MIESVPADNVLILKVAVPLVSVPVPSAIVPLLNVTDSPSGTLPPVEVTVAVKVTGYPTGDGFTLEVTMVVVVFLTICDSAPKLELKVVSPG